MIIWTGNGILAPLILIGVTSALMLGVDLCTGIDNFSDSHRWVYSIGCLLGGICCWFVGKAWNCKPGKIYIEEKTGQRTELKDSHTCYFIPFEYWAVIGIIASIVVWFY